MDQHQPNKMGVMPVPKLILTMSLPSMFSMLVLALYNIVDSMFVAQYSHDALTAVSLVFPIQMLLIAVTSGTGIGLNSLISRRLGERKVDQANSAATHGILLALFNWVIFALVAVFFSKPFMSMFTDDVAVGSMGVTYMQICLILSFGSCIQICIEKIFQAQGNMIYPMIFQLVGAIFNIIFDPILIFGKFGFPEMGIAGAAYATVGGQILGMMVAVFVLIKRKQQVHVSFKKFRFQWGMVKNIYAVGLPSIFMQAIGSFLTLGLNGILISFSHRAVDVLGVYFKMQSFVFMPVFGLTNGVLSAIGYNYGAGDKQRIYQSLKTGYLIAVVIMFIGSCVFWLIPDKLLMIFNANEEMLRIGVPAFRIIAINFIPAAIGIISSSFFQAIGMGNRSLFISVLRQLVIILPVFYLFAQTLGVQSVWWAFPISESVSLVVSIVFVAQIIRKKIRVLVPIEERTKPDPEQLEGQNELRPELC